MVRKIVKRISEDEEYFLQTGRGFNVKKSSRSTRVVLVYPNYYRIGMSNLGFQAVYALINTMEGVRCERAFLPELWNCGSSKVLTVESRTPIEKFDIIAFSISFENDVLSILRILHRSGLPLLSSQRNDDAPLILAGGVLCFLNPEPLASFVDCFLIGEAEAMLKDFFGVFDPDKRGKNSLISMARNIPSLYIPAFFTTRYTARGTIENFVAVEKVPVAIKRAIARDITTNPTNTVVLTPNTVFSKTFLIELSRGCNHGCRFCSAGYVYRPLRFQSQCVLEKQIRDGAALTNKIGLVGAAVSDYPNIESICCKSEWKDINFAISSLRADNVTHEIVEMLRKNNIKTVTIAPDAGSERLRKVINKGITEEHILSAVELFILGGIPNLKLYFIVGLPTETENDVEAIVVLCKKIKNCFLKFSRFKSRIGRITVSLNPFIPKPFTPFQWVAMDETRVLKKKMNFIKKKLQCIANIRVQAESVRASYIQALIARGDRRITEILISAHKNNYNWPKTLKASNVSTDFYVHRERNLDEIFPWDFLQQCVSKHFLLKEYKLAMNNCTSPPCHAKVRECKLCGVCSSFSA